MAHRGHRQFEPHQVREIRSLYTGGASITRLADFWNVNRSAIWDMVHFRTYKEVGGPRQQGPRICPHCRQILPGKKPQTPA